MGHQGAPGVHKFLVCAPNTALGLPAELQDSTRILRGAIEEYLQAQGREVAWLDLYEGKRLWTGALARAKEEGDISRTPALFVQELTSRIDFQAVVMPSILVKKARASMSSARWDGVSRRMQMVNTPERATGRDQNTFADGIAHGGITGDVLVTSVHVMVFSREGARIFEGRGGIDFLHELDMAMAKSHYRYEMRLRADPLGDPEALQEGLGIAFSPYLPPVEP